MKRFRTLYLLSCASRWNQVSDDGLKALAGALPANTTLRELHLFGNAFSPVCVRSVFVSLLSNNLSLSPCGVREKASKPHHGRISQGQTIGCVSGTDCELCCTTGQHYPAASRAKAGQVAEDHEVTTDACIQVLSELSAQFPAIITTCVSADMVGSPQC